jgi:hypothetical protein
MYPSFQPTHRRANVAGRDSATYSMSSAWVTFSPTLARKQAIHHQEIDVALAQRAGAELGKGGELSPQLCSTWSRSSISGNRLEGGGFPPSSFRDDYRTAIARMKSALIMKPLHARIFSISMRPCITRSPRRSASAVSARSFSIAPRSWAPCLSQHSIERGAVARFAPAPVQARTFPTQYPLVVRKRLTVTGSLTVACEARP